MNVFAKQEIVSFMESIGMRFGPELNAFTSFDETVYMLQVPTDQPELLAKGLQILEEWAHRVSFDDEEIDKERGVIVEEFQRVGPSAIRDRLTHRSKRVARSAHWYGGSCQRSPLEVPTIVPL